MKNVLIVGAGQVGAHIAHCGVNKNLAVHFHLLDHDEKLTEAHTLDLKDTLLFSKNSKISHMELETLDSQQMDIIIITAGANQLPGETRLDLLAKNTAILKSIASDLGELSPHTVIILVTNPVDIMTKIAQDIFNLPTSQILGTGTLLDSARLRWRIAERLNININNAHGYVLGEHGDSEFIAWTTVNSDLNLSDSEKSEVAESVRKEAYEIIKGKGATYFGIGASTIHLVEAIINDSREIMPVSVNYPYFSNESLRQTPLGMPAIIGKSGIMKTPVTTLSEQETSSLELSAERLYEAYRSTL